MTVLNTLTPAEILVLTKGSFTTLRKLLKVTFLDLVLKQVLKSKLPTFELDAGTTNVNEKYVVPGSRFFSHTAKPHEQFVLAAFYDYPNTSLLFKYVVELAYKNVRSKSRFLSAVCCSSAMEGLVYRSYIDRLFGTVTFTPAGKAKRAVLKQELDDAATQLQELASYNRPAALEMLAVLGGSILLLENTDLTALGGIDQELLAMVQEPHQRNTDNSSGCGGGCGTWDSVADYSSGWDSGCGSSDGNSSGCGGDSGCGSGGDSGCSGCGGCGGD